MLLEMKQSQLAEAAGVGENTIALFEAGQQTPHASTMKKIVDALDHRGITFTNGGSPGVVLNRERAIVPTK